MPVVWTRYPWLCGYLISPAAFHFVTSSTTTFSISNQCYFWAEPLLTSSTASTDALRICWYFHFLRRAAEVVFLNVYHGKGIPNERDSIGEFFYYLIWGLINGCTATCGSTTTAASLLSTTEEDESFNIVVSTTTGLILFWVGQIGNFYCHVQLRYLRPNKDDNRWIVPQKFPFSILIAPHYTFELLIWFGYMLIAGFAPPSIFIFIISIVTLLDMSTKRKQKYIKMYKEEGQGEGSDNNNNNNKYPSSPETRWVLIPFLY